MGPRRSRDESVTCSGGHREGFVLKAQVHSAKVMDYEGIKTLLCARRMSTFLASGISVVRGGLPRGGQGQGLGTEKTLGWSAELVERPREPAPEEVLIRWAAEWAKEGVAVDWQKLIPPKGFVVLPRRRWVVERTIAWIDQQRRMSKDYERLCASGEALVYAAMRSAS